MIFGRKTDCKTLGHDDWGVLRCDTVCSGKNFIGDSVGNTVCAYLVYNNNLCL